MDTGRPRSGGVGFVKGSVGPVVETPGLSGPVVDVPLSISYTSRGSSRSIAEGDSSPPLL